MRAIAPRERGDGKRQKKKKQNRKGGPRLRTRTRVFVQTVQTFQLHISRNSSCGWTNTGFPDILDVHFEKKATKGGQASYVTQHTEHGLLWDAKKKAHHARAGVRRNQPIKYPLCNRKTFVVGIEVRTNACLQAAVDTWAVGLQGGAEGSVGSPGTAVTTWGAQVSNSSLDYLHRSIYVVKKTLGIQYLNSIFATRKGVPIPPVVLCRISLHRAPSSLSQKRRKHRNHHSKQEDSSPDPRTPQPSSVCTHQLIIERGEGLLPGSPSQGTGGDACHKQNMTGCCSKSGETGPLTVEQVCVFHVLNLPVG